MVLTATVLDQVLGSRSRAKHALDLFLTQLVSRGPLIWPTGLFNAFQTPLNPCNEFPLAELLAMKAESRGPGLPPVPEIRLSWRGCGGAGKGRGSVGALWSATRAGPWARVGMRVFPNPG